MVVISGLNWESDLTPWKAAGVKGGEFEGKARSFFDRLKEDLFVNIESPLILSNTKRFLIGVSLSGLFGTWAAFISSQFTGVGSVSSSLRYDGCTEWISAKDNTTCTKFYFSLGEKEKKGRIEKAVVWTLSEYKHTESTEL